MLGRYENFPENVHHLTFLGYQTTPKSLQQTIISTFTRLNNETFDLASITPYIKRRCEVGFEFGVADGFEFNFLDQNELEKCLENIEEKELRVLDFFFVVRYHTVKEGNRKVPLRFDYHVVRFVFHGSQLEIRIRHEKGSQRVPLDELTGFIVNQINRKLSGAQLPALVVNEMEKSVIEFSD